MDDLFQKRYSGARPGDGCARRRLEALWRWHEGKGLAEPEARSRLASANDAVFWQQLSEILVAQVLSEHGLLPTRQTEQQGGPDFLIENNGRRIWVEVICPEPKGVPADWLAPMCPSAEQMKGRDVPHKELLLRWTAAIKEKFEKLCGYRKRKIVGTNDAFVIAINGRLLRGQFPDIQGISQLPYAVEATLAVGPYAIHINAEAMQVTRRGHAHRPNLPKANKALVPTDTFFDPRYAPVSAIWGFDFDENTLLDQRQPSILVHNPRARRRVPMGLFPAHFEYHAKIDADPYCVERRDGRWAPPPHAASDCRLTRRQSRFRSSLDPCPPAAADC